MHSPWTALAVFLPCHSLNHNEQLIFNMGEIPFSRCHEAADNHLNFVSHLGKFWAKGVLGMLGSPPKGHPKSSSAETPDVSLQPKAGGGAEMFFLLNAVSNLTAGPNSSSPLLLGGVWAEGWCPETTDQGCSSVGPNYSFCAPTLLFHTNFWKISSNFAVLCFWSYCF